MIKIIRPKKNSCYLEILQQMPGTFAFVYKKDESTYEQKHFPQKCRDFLGDTVWGNFNNEKVDVFGFKFNPETESLDSDATRLVYYGKTVKLFKDIKFLNDIEKSNGLMQTKLKKVTGGVLIEGDKKWIKYVWSISLYSFIIKVLANSSFDLLPEGSNEAYYASRVNLNFLFSHIEDLMKVESDTITGWTEKEEKDISFVHSYSGFFNLFSLKNRNVFSCKYNELLHKT